MPLMRARSLPYRVWRYLFQFSKAHGKRIEDLASMTLQNIQRQGALQGLLPYDNRTADDIGEEWEAEAWMEKGFRGGGG